MISIKNKIIVAILLTLLVVFILLFIVGISKEDEGEYYEGMKSELPILVQIEIDEMRLRKKRAKEYRERLNEKGN